MLKTTEDFCGISLNCEKEHHIHPKLGKQFQAVKLFPVRKSPLNLILICLDRCFPWRDYNCNCETRWFRTFTTSDLKEAKKNVHPDSQEREWDERSSLTSALCFPSTYKQVSAGGALKSAAEGQAITAPGSSTILKPLLNYLCHGNTEQLFDNKSENKP